MLVCSQLTDLVSSAAEFCKAAGELAGPAGAWLYVCRQLQGTLASTASFDGIGRVQTGHSFCRTGVLTSSLHSLLGSMVSTQDSTAHAQCMPVTRIFAQLGTYRSFSLICLQDSAGWSLTQQQMSRASMARQSGQRHALQSHQQTARSKSSGGEQQRAVNGPLT
jgi:hypothetical protein